jgi:hypothetical protein
MIPLFTVLLAANASAADVPVLQAQPMAGALTANPAAAKSALTSKATASPKLTAAIATRNSDGKIEVGCVEQPNPRARSKPINTTSPEPQQ